MLDKAEPAPPPLPHLREDLVLQRGALSADGTRAWLIYDALQHRFLQIDAATFSILAVWRTAKSAPDLIATVESQLGYILDETEFKRLVSFLETHSLLDAGPSKGWKALSAAAARRRPSLMSGLAHNYLFYRIPLFRPDRFLRLTMPLVAPLFTKFACVLVLVLGTLGLYLVSRQWEHFIGTAGGLWSADGAVALAVTLFAVKAVHELGHAYTATRYGCHVPSIGIAFVMMAPMPYTDVTDAWRLKDRYKRVNIDSAGIFVEIGLACVATFLWAFLPDGMPRQVAFLVASTSWIMSVGINLNPFMRFDGYYILADLVRIENLQPRAFDVGIWKLREILFGLGDNCPEIMSRRTINWLVIYAWTTWCFRLLTFIGIAAAVYFYFFKILGVALFLFEIIYFVAKPIYNELKEWWSMRARIAAKRRFYRPALGLLLAIGIFAWPWSATVYVPAVLEGRDLSRIYAPRPARIQSVHAVQGQSLADGTLLMKLESPLLNQEEALTVARAQATRLRLSRRTADAQDRADYLILEEELAALTARMRSLAAEREQLEIRAPSAGVLMELSPDLHAGRWLAAKQQLAVVSGSSQATLNGYVHGDDLWRVKAGANGRFFPDNAEQPSSQAVLSEVAVTGATQIEIADLASINGGTIDVEQDARQRLVPSQAQYRVRLDVAGDHSAPAQATRGFVRMEGVPESLLARAWRQVLKVLVREAGA